MKTTNIHEAKTHLSRLVQRAADGEENIISKAGKPLAKPVPYRETSGPREPGLWRGKVRMSDDFDTLPPEFDAAFRGESQ